MQTVSFDLLRVLIAVAESNNFREAANKLGISQPAVTMKLRELQSFEEVPLFALEGKRKVLTHYGRSLYELAKENTVDLTKKIENLQRAYSSPELLTIRVGGRSDVLEFVAPHLQFDGKIELFSLSSRAAVEDLQKHKIDIAMSYIIPDSAEIQAKKLFTSKAYFVVHEKFLKKRKLTKEIIRSHEFLTGVPCVCYQQTGHLIVDWCEEVGLSFEKLKIKYIAEDWRSIWRLVEKGEGYAIVPSYALNEVSGIQNLEIPGSVLPHLDFYALFETGLRKIPAFKKLLSLEQIPLK